MKRLCSLTLALMLTLSLAACGGTSGSQADTPAPAEPSDASIELIVYAAASMTETLQEIAGLYAEAAPNVTLTFNFDSSGTLKTQIQEGADCDLFISAGQKQMDQLDIASSPEVNTEGLDFVDTDSRVDLLENRVVLVVPDGNPKDIQSFDDMAAGLSGWRWGTAMYLWASTPKKSCATTVWTRTRWPPPAFSATAPM